MVFRDTGISLQKEVYFAAGHAALERNLVAANNMSAPPVAPRARAPVNPRLPAMSHGSKCIPGMYFQMHFELEYILV